MNGNNRLKLESGNINIPLIKVNDALDNVALLHAFGIAGDQFRPRPQLALRNVKVERMVANNIDRVLRSSLIPRNKHGRRQIW